MTTIQPSVVGAQDAELEHLTRGQDTVTTLVQLPVAAERSVLSADAVLEALYWSFLSSAEREKLQSQRLKINETAAKQQRREIYLNARRQRTWRKRSKAFLARHPSLPQQVSSRVLYSILAMQHLLERDIVDLSLPAEQRCSEDTYTDDGVNDQFLMDAARGRFVVEKEVFNFAEASEATAEAEDDFVARLVVAVRACCPEPLLPAVTTVMCQSGLAALEKASLCSTAVSGGVQEVDYELWTEEASDQRDSQVLKLQLQVRRSGFREYLHETADDLEPMPCDRGSYINKSATVVFHPESIERIDVVAFAEEIDIRVASESIAPHNFCRPLPMPPAREAEATASNLDWYGSVVLFTLAEI